MDNEQIKLFVEENIIPSESHDEITRREILRFIIALQEQQINLGRSPKASQIVEAWKRWRTEHVDAPKAHNIYVTANKEAIADAAAQHINKTDEAIASNEMLASEAIIFAKTYSHQLCCLAKIPAPEHITLAWNQWKSSRRL